MTPVLQLGEVGWSMVRAAWCRVALVFAVMHLYNTLFVCIASVYFFFILFFKKSGIDEWSTIPACPSLMCFFNRGYTEGTNSSKILCPMFMYVLFYVNLCHD